MKLRGRRTVVALLLTVLAAPVAVAQDDVLVLRGGRVHTMVEGEDAIENGVVVIRDGRIAAVGGADTAVPAGAVVVEVEGHVFPGFFDAVTRIGLTEIGQVAVTSDFRELGDNNPHLQAATAVHPASEIIPVTRANGITHAAAAPQGNGLAGQGSLIHLDGWTVEEMLVERGLYLVAQWPSIGGGGGRFGGFRRGRAARPFSELKEEYDQQIADLEALLADAQRYAAADVGDDPTRRDLKLEALGRVISGELPLLVNVNSRRQIRDAIAFGERNGVRVILAGAREAWKMAEEIAAAGVPVILGPTQSVPGEDDPYDAAFTAPARLHAAGVPFAISTFNASSARTLPYEAAQAVAFGLPYRAAVAAITSNPARILGVDDRLGTIEAGKLANLVVSGGDPLEIATSVDHIVINGRLLDPRDNKHDRLYERYSGRPTRQQR